MSGRVKIKQLKKVVGDVNISGMFEEMMGVKDAEAEIIAPKFVFVRNSLRYVYRVLNQFCNILGGDFPMYEEHFADIRKFAEEFKESTYLKHDHDEKEEQYAGLTKEEINGLYRKLKENSYVRRLIVLCSKLKRYESSFTDQNNLKENFVNQEPGLTFQIFEFSKLDLKALWASERIKPSVKRYVLMVLATLYKHTHALYKCVTSPDVDVEKFTQMLISAIGELKKQPQLHRCHNAFRRIEQSVELLRDKFDDYYRDSIASENADMLVMNFIVDVSNQGGANATLAREFRTIIKYMHEVSNKTGKSKDPNVQKIFKMLNNNFTLMEKNVGLKPQKSGDTQPDTGISATTDMDELKASGTVLEEPEVPVEPDEIAEEKQAKRIEKQKAKKRKSKKKKASSLAAVNEADSLAVDDTQDPTQEDNNDDHTNGDHTQEETEHQE